MGWGRNRLTPTCSCISLHAHDQYSTLHHSTAFTACLFTVRLLFAVPSSVPTSEAPFSSRSSRHSYLRPHTQRSTGGHVRSLVGCHHKEIRPTLLPCNFCRACSDSTYAGHHILRPLLTTVLVVKKQNIKLHNPFRNEMSG